jgi:hypothetical protein
MSVARRIQLQRTSGWRKPPDAVVVSRPGRWGNPFRIGINGTRSECVALFRTALMEGALRFTEADIRQVLADRDLACWCSLNDECHANVLLEIANG